MNVAAAEFSRLFLETLRKPLRQSVPLRDFSTFGIGGPADFFFETVSPEDLKSSLDLAERLKVPFYVIGGGSNILFDDDGFRGLIIRNRVAGLSRQKDKGEIEAFSGAPLSDLVGAAAEKGLAGLEFLAGIPGTVGGAVCGNAGAFGRSVGDSLIKSVILRLGGKEFEAGKEYFEFGYRHSSLPKKREVLLQAVFGLECGERAEIESRMADYLRKRAAKHPPENTACAGSYFRNPQLPDGTKAAAGFLLEQAETKNLTVGRAAVFPGHANFIVNTGGATSRDVLRLAGELKERVAQKFGVMLEEEVIYLPPAFSTP